VCIVFTDGFESRPKRRVPSDRSATPMPLDQAMAATSLECVELDERTLAVPLKGERVEKIVIQASPTVTLPAKPSPISCDFAKGSSS
jgi:hypothetical protein